MKKILIYFIACLTIIVTGCTDFGTENQLTLPAAPAVEISNVVAGNTGQSITFTVAPTGEAGLYSWVVVRADNPNPDIVADQVFRMQVAGVDRGIIQYDTLKSKTITVSDLTPFTVYQIYAIASSPDGVLGIVQNTSIRTSDNGGIPTPTQYTLSGENMTLTFSEPLKLGTGKVFVSYFAKNTLTGPKLSVSPGFENFNPQNIEVSSNNLSINGNALVIKLPAPPAGIYASITYEAGAVLDLSDNTCNPYTTKADTLVDGIPSRGITVHVANKTWALHSEFEEDPTKVQTFAQWDELMISAIPDDGITVGRKVATIIPTVVYHEQGKISIVDVVSWGTVSGTPAFMLPEEPARGAIVDLNIPAGAFEDVYGNASDALNIEGNYLYSFGYTMADVVGTYDVDFISYFDGPLPTESGIVIEASGDGDGVLIKNLVEAGTVVEGTFDPIGGTITLADEQLLLPDVDFGASGTGDILFVNVDASAPVVFNVPAAGTITSPVQMWGYYIDPLGWYDVFTESTWTRTSTNVTSAPFMMKAAVRKTVKPGGRILRK